MCVNSTGCTACGHLFSNTSWNDLPGWDPLAQAKIDFDTRARLALRLLTKQVRLETALLAYEMAALEEARVTTTSTGTGATIATPIAPPPRKPKLSRWLPVHH
mmetsp:Transcript_38654/g.65832  ORF Transcript_38654/g.65832 Transcript_38654/m.65832 type:complete len:103 (+) Transcript_38654:1560-1868(+)